MDLGEGPAGIQATLEGLPRVREAAVQVIGVISEDWLIFSAIVQAGAAVVIGLFTYFLWRSTSKLAGASQRDVELTQKSVELTEQMARLQTIVLAREVALAAPRLITKLGERTVTEDRVVQEIEVENVGGAIAHDIEIETSWSIPVIPGPLRPRSKGVVVTPVISRSEWDTLPDPDNEPII